MLKAKKIAQDELNASLAEQASVLETDTLELRKLETAVANGATYEEAFASSIKNASTAAKEHAIQTKGASGSTDVFVSKQRSAQASLRATATASKTASVAMRALSMVMNMIAIGLITKGLELLGSAISNYIHRVEKANEKIEESRSSYEDAKSSIESMNDELKTTQDKIDDLQSKGTLSFTDKAELDNLKAQNDELERSISLEEKKKQNAASQTVNDIKQNKDTLSDDFEESIKNLSEYQEEYEHMKQVGIKGISDKTVTPENYEVTMTAMDKNMDLYEKHVLENIEKFEKYKEDIINKYNTDDVSQFSQSDRDLYNSIVSQLQKAYKIIYSDSEYNKFVIEPIFDEEKLKGLQDELLKYFISGGQTDLSSLEEKFGTDIITALRSACEKAGIDFDKMIEDMYNNSQSKLDQIVPLVDKPNGVYDAKQNQISKQIRDYIQNDLSDEDRTILLNATIPDDVKFKTKQDVDNFIASLREDADKNDSSSLLSFAKAWENLKSVGDEAKDVTPDLLELAKAGELSNETLKTNADYNTLLEDTGLKAREARYEIMQMITEQERLAGFQSKMGNVATLYNEFKDKGFVTAETLEGLPDVFKNMNGGKDFDLFSKIVGDPTSGKKKIQVAFNDIVTEYIKDQDILIGTSEETRDSVIANLKDAGVTNAKEVVDSYIASIDLIDAAESEFYNESAKQRTTDINNFQAALKDKNTSFEDACKVLGTNNAALITSMGKQYADDYANWLDLLDKKKKAYNEFVKAYNQATDTEDASSIYQQTQKGADGASAYSIATGVNEKERQAKEAAKKAKKAKNELAKYQTIDLNFDVAEYSPKDTSSKGKSSSKDKTKSTEIIDWIERKLSVLQNKIDYTKSKFENLFSLDSKQNNLDKQITQTTTLLNAQAKAAEKYQKKADSIKISKNKKKDADLKNKVRNGQVKGSLNELIATYGEKTANQISKYQDYIQKAKEAKQATEDTFASIIELNNQKLDNITEQYDKFISQIEAAQSKIQSTIDLTSKISGLLGKSENGSTQSYQNLLNSQSSQISTLKAEKKDVSKQYDDNIKNGVIELRKKLKSEGKSKAEIKAEVKAYKDEMKSQKATAMDEYDSQINQAYSDMLDTSEAMANIPISKASIAIDGLSTELDNISAQMNLTSGTVKNLGDDLDYYDSLYKAENMNKAAQLQEYRNAESTIRSNLQSLSEELAEYGIDASKDIKDATDLREIKKKYGDDALEAATLYISNVSALNEASKNSQSALNDWLQTVHDNAQKMTDIVDSFYQDVKEQIDNNRQINELERERATSLDKVLKSIDKDSRYAQKSLDQDAYNANTHYTNAQTNQSNVISRLVELAASSANNSAMYNWVAEQIAYGFSEISGANGVKYMSNSNATDLDTLRTYVLSIPDMTEKDKESIIQWIENLFSEASASVSAYNTYELNNAKLPNTIAENFKSKFETIDEWYQRDLQALDDTIESADNKLSWHELNGENINATTYQKGVSPNAYTMAYNADIRNWNAFQQKIRSNSQKSGLIEEELSWWNELYEQGLADGSFKKDDPTAYAILDMIAEKQKEKDAIDLETQQLRQEYLTTAFENTQKEYDRKIQEIENNITKANNKISLDELNGKKITADYYSSISDDLNKQIEQRTKENQDLQDLLQAGLDNGDIVEGSDKWYELTQEIVDSNNAIDELSISLAETAKNARQATYELNDWAREGIDDIISEADFYQQLVSRDKQFDDNGNLTDSGVSNIALSLEKMSADISKNKSLTDELRELDKKYVNDKLNTEYIDRRNQLTNAIYDTVDAYYAEQDAVKSLIEEGLNAELDALDELINKYTDALDEAKSLRDFERQISDLTKKRESLLKQQKVLQGQDSEEARAKLQSINVQLQEAQQDLNDAYYDKYIEDQKAILDDMNTSMQEFVEEQFEHLDSLVNQLVNGIVGEGDTVYGKIKELADTWNIALSKPLEVSLKASDYAKTPTAEESTPTSIASEQVTKVEEERKQVNEPYKKSGSVTSDERDRTTTTTQQTPTPTPTPPPVYTTPKPTTTQSTYPGKIAGWEATKKSVSERIDNDGNDTKVASTLLKAVRETMKSELSQTSSGYKTFDDFFYGKYGTYLSDDGIFTLKKILGANSIDNLVGKLKTQYGFKTGGIAQLVKPQGEDGLAWLRNGEGLVAPENVADIKDLLSTVPTMNNLIDKLLPLQNIPIQKNQQIKPVNIESVQQVFELPNVTDVDSFIKEAKNNPKMARFMDDMVYDRMTGDNSVSRW